MELRDEDGSLYQALLEKDARYDGSVYYAISSTGIFCRPVCTARKPKQANVRYFGSAREAINAGFRPCKLCAPLDFPDNIPPAYRDLLHEVTSQNGLRLRDQDLRQRGLEPASVRRWFQKRYGLTFQAFARSFRLAGAFDAIRCGSRVLDAALSAGYDSASGFSAAVKESTGQAPSVASTGAGAIYLSRFETPLGTMVAGGWQERLCLLEFADRRALETELADLEHRLQARVIPGYTPLHATVERQLLEYFRRQRRDFELPLATPGSLFQNQVWQELRAIPYGQTRSYRAQATALGRPQAVRAVASANGHNRIAIVIPCHRVIGSDGKLVGYAGGLPRKQALLELEGALPARI
ncbi:MAG: hypothetical protein A2004_11460 [Spirochaetes bacterium GWC1_61_12]|nr:MAG: hypothetical protein A2Y37_12580 [Spirochaetes bacterium GWB1_60_80]OHD30431.1 MAG: hypothetical protein A2004_11460 [Spirochaetes bacterium GWC1_61_12]OHD43231.1 MAG: hypothetical protein A2Y35_08370 [Spirochaetes bacterium GWE1_60_18]OHD58791.1 MAG: hypothetical protein A2Y32_01205 [Spirochaetes bacterium GWF1_60_12]HAP42710.1 XRE family transcriptional regulator [Spirochaetaceae bacterium]